MDSDDQIVYSKSHTKHTKESRKKPQISGSVQEGQGSKSQSGKLRGLEKDSLEVRLSKTLSWLLRHGAKSERLPMRADGYVRVADLLANPRIKSKALDLVRLQEIVKADAKQRYELVLEGLDSGAGEWWIRANQGHSIKSVKLELKPIVTVRDIPTGVAVHGTSRKAWNAISREGLSKMTRNHIHLAQGVVGEGVISGMRGSSQIFIYIDVQKALASGIEFFLSDNGVVLTEGDERGLLKPDLFDRVEDAKGFPVTGWERVQMPAVVAEPPMGELS
ncbi:hypothetical protein L208DRAFT_1257876 [Tricholoma matsutake]|nr:hypothetical protein L208DRAFT_1257876 [Tricholoma matsutake 945]